MYEHWSPRHLSITLSCINRIIQLSISLGYEYEVYQSYRDHLLIHNF